MGSLITHLRCPEDRGRLAFQQQLAGRLAAEVVVGRRTQALLAAGVLAVSSAAPTAVLAAEPDQEQEGTTAPEQVVAAEPPSEASFDPGGQPTDLPFNAAPAPAAQISPDPVATVEQDPATNEDAPTADHDGSDAPQEPATSEPVAAPPAPEQAPIEPPATAPAPEPEAATPAQPEAAAPPRAQEREEPPEPQSRPQTTPPRTVRAVPTPFRVTLAPAPRPEPTYSAAGASARTMVAPRATSSAAASRGRAAHRGDRFHVVRRDESLWSIVTDLLDDGATPARIAREVDRLWELNGARIGTGNPDLVIAGTRLALR